MAWPDQPGCADAGIVRGVKGNRLVMDMDVCALYSGEREGDGGGGVNNDNDNDSDSTGDGEN